MAAGDGLCVRELRQEYSVERRRSDAVLPTDRCSGGRSRHRRLCDSGVTVRQRDPRSGDGSPRRSIAEPLWAQWYLYPDRCPDLRDRFCPALCIARAGHSQCGCRDGGHRAVSRRLRGDRRPAQCIAGHDGRRCAPARAALWLALSVQFDGNAGNHRCDPGDQRRAQFGRQHGARRGGSAGWPGINIGDDFPLHGRHGHGTSPSDIGAS